MSDKCNCGERTNEGGKYNYICIRCRKAEREGTSEIVPAASVGASISAAADAAERLSTITRRITQEGTQYWSDWVADGRTFFSYHTLISPDEPLPIVSHPPRSFSVGETVVWRDPNDNARTGVYDVIGEMNNRNELLLSEPGSEGVIQVPQSECY